MKTIIGFLAVFLLLMVVSCSSKKGKTDSDSLSVPVLQDKAPVATEASQIMMKELSGYFLKNSYTPEDSINLVVLKDKAQFDSMLGVAKTMNNKIDIPDFEHNIVVAVPMQSTNQKTDIKLDSAKKEGNIVNVYINIIRSENLSYTMAPVVVFSLPKDATATQIQLFVNGEKSKIENF